MAGTWQSASRPRGTILRRSRSRSNGDDITHSFHIVVDKNGEYAFDVAEGFTLNRFRADIYGQALIDDLKDEQKTATADQMMEFLTGS